MRPGKFRYYPPQLPAGVEQASLNKHHAGRTGDYLRARKRTADRICREGYSVFNIRKAGSPGAYLLAVLCNNERRPVLAV